MRGEHRLGERRETSFVSDVQDVLSDLDAVLPGSCHRLGQTGLVTVHQRQGTGPGGKIERQRPSNATGGSRYDGHTPATGKLAFAFSAIASPSGVAVRPK